jgi:hypothetical protein
MNFVVRMGIIMVLLMVKLIVSITMAVYKTNVFKNVQLRFGTHGHVHVPTYLRHPLKPYIVK